MSGISVERRRDVLKQLHGELVKIMGNIEGLDRAVAQLEKQAHDQSEGNNDLYIRRIAMRLQRTKEKVEATKAQTNQQQRQSNAHLLRPTPSPPPMQQHQHQQQQQHQQPQQYKQQHYQHPQQHHYQGGQYQQHQQQQPQYQPRAYQQQGQFGQSQQAPLPAAPAPGAYTQGQPGQHAFQAPPDAYPAHSNQSSSNIHHGMNKQPSMETDAEIFAEMAQDLLLGPAQAQQVPRSAQPSRPAQPSAQNMQTNPQGYLAPDQTQSWQHQLIPQALPQQSQQMHQAQGARRPAAPASTGPQMFWPGQQPQVSQPYSQQPPQHQQPPPQQSGLHDPAITEKYWQLLELMRQEFLADIAEYYNCMAPNIESQMQPAYASKLGKMKSVIQRLSISRDMPHYHKRPWSQADLDALQHLAKQLRMYCAKIRTALAPIREAKRKELQLAAQRAGQDVRMPAISGGPSQVAQAEAPGLPSEAALVRQPSVAAAVHQALPDMPVPPLTYPLSNTSSESRDLPEGTSHSGGAAEETPAAAIKQEVAPAGEAAGAPAQSLVSRLAGATPGALGCAGAAAEKVLKRKADLISSPSLPQHLQLALQGNSSSSEAFLRVESSNVSQSGHEDVSPDRVFDFEAASRATPSPKEAQRLQQLREKLEKEVEEGLRDQQGTTIIHESDVPNTLIVKFTPAPAEGASAVGTLKSPCFDRQLSLRVDTGYPESTPAYFRQVSPEQTVQEHSQASAVQEHFQTAVKHFQGALTVTNLVKLWEQALQ